MDDELRHRLDRIEQNLAVLVEQRTQREWYSVEQAAEVLGKAPYTIREHCRAGRINARKLGSGRGPHACWAIAHAELLRIQAEGLLPLRHQN